MIDAALLLIDTGLASKYGYIGDKYDNVGQYACKDRLIKKLGKKQWDFLMENGVAHRTLPCGSKVKICHKKDCIIAYVVDRGPYGALDTNGKWHNRSRGLQPGEHYRGVLDLLPLPAEKLNITGLHRISVWTTNEKKSLILQHQKLAKKKLPDTMMDRLYNGLSLIGYPQIGMQTNRIQKPVKWHGPVGAQVLQARAIRRRVLILKKSVVYLWIPYWHD